MSWIVNRSTRTKLFFSFGLILALLGIVTITAYKDISAMEVSQRQLFEKSFATSRELMRLQIDLERQRVLILEAVLKPDHPLQGSLLERLGARAADIDDTYETLTHLLRDDTGAVAQLAALQASLAQYRQGRAQVAAAITDGQSERAVQLSLAAQNALFETVRRVADELAEAQQASVQAALTQAQAKVVAFRRLFIGTGIVAAALGLTLVLVLSRLIADPLKRLAAAAAQVAEGNLVVDFTAKRRDDEVGVLNLAFYELTDRLRRQIRQISDGIGVLNTSSSEISVSTSQLASSASQTAAAVGETTTTVAEVRQTAQVASDKALAVSAAAQKVAQTAQDGRQATEGMIEGMSRIREQMESIAQSMIRLSEQSQAVGQIVATVEDLAAQSNLLAVNASIEATRAGEHGKGFAVVAQEVKSLAGESKQATARVRAILGEIQKATGAAVMATEQGSKAVEAGVVQSTLAGRSIQTLVEGMTEAAHAAAQIAASSQQQLAGVDQVASAMTSINQAGAQNVDSARQMEAAAGSIKALAEGLKRLIDHYKT